MLGCLDNYNRFKTAFKRKTQTKQKYENCSLWGYGIITPYPAHQTTASDDEINSSHAIGDLPPGKCRRICPERNAGGEECFAGKDLPGDQATNRLFFFVFERSAETSPHRGHRCTQ